ncbi:MAG: ferredoxin--nitrite reductase [Nitrospinae bacterium]|nr:ferredoxin--nitrite reductase [Nitrospinota bacterium]
MNKIEVLKSEKDGLKIKDDIARFAKEGWESISEDDIQRLKWYGLFLRNPKPGFFMQRVRIPNGICFSHQVKALCSVAKDFGNGTIDITTRQQVQLRNLKIEDVPEIFAIQEEVGLTSIQTGLDNVRNIMGCPVAGLSPKEKVDAYSQVKALTEHISGNSEFSNLPRKFNIAITGCADDCVHAETQDLALVPAVQELGGNSVYGFNVLVGGKLGSGGYRIATSLDVFILPEDVVRVCSAIILIFRDHGSRGVRSKNRLAFLIEEWGEEKFRNALQEKISKPLIPAGVDLRANEKSEHIGIYRQKQASMNYVGLKVPVGRIHADKLQGIAGIATKYGNGEIRFSHSNSLIIPNVPDQKLGDLLEEPLVKEFTYHPSSVMRGLVSCVGIDYCHLATIETKGRALQVAAELEDKLPDIAPITTHWSGCPAGCGNHLVADIGLLGKKIKQGKEIVDAVDVYMGGRTGIDPKLAVKVMEDVPCDDLAKVLEFVVPYHTREKMHPIKGKKYKRNWKKAPPSQLLDKEPVIKNAEA